MPDLIEVSCCRENIRAGHKKVEFASILQDKCELITNGKRGPGDGENFVSKAENLNVVRDV
jgi:hypothetical protein